MPQSDWVQSLPVAAYTTDAAGRIETYNAAAVELWRIQPQVGASHFSEPWLLLSSDGTPLAAEATPVGIALSDGRAVRDFELLAERSDRTRIAVLSFASPLKDATGRVTGAVDVLLDWTQRKISADAAAHLGAIVSASDDAIISKTLEGKVTSWNAAATRLFGHEPDEMIGQSITRIIPPEFLAEEQEIIARLRRGERLEHFETVRLTRDGRPVHVSLTVSPIRDSSGRIVGASKTARDITERREWEQRLRELQAELLHASRVSAMGQMASALAHELKQPLSAISNYMNAARRVLTTGDRPNLPRTEELIAKAAGQAVRAGELIERLRSFISKGEQKLSPEDINSIIREAVSLAEIGGDLSDVVVETSFEPELPRTMIDRIQIQQVMINLMRNAAEAMKSAPRRILVVKTRTAAGKSIEVSVTDTGPGIPDQILANLFRPFVTTKQKGLGIGLTISKSIIDAHRGQIWAEPNQAGGTTFRFTLPFDSPENF